MTGTKLCKNDNLPIRQTQQNVDRSANQRNPQTQHLRASVKTDMMASLDDEEAIDHDHLEFLISDIS